MGSLYHLYSAGMGALAEQERLKVIGQLGAQRSELLKNIPTASEGQALKNFSYTIWTGFMVPKNTPEDRRRPPARGDRQDLARPGGAHATGSADPGRLGADDAGRIGKVLRGRDRALPRHRQPDQSAAAMSRHTAAPKTACAVVQSRDLSLVSRS